MSNTLLRQWVMLKAVPRLPSKISTPELQALLEKEGYVISLRTIQRDLKNLSRMFPGLESDGNKDIAGWYWKLGSEIHDFPAIDPPMALTFKLAQSFLDNLIPPSVMELLQPYLVASDKVLSQLDETGYQHWSGKVAIVPRTQPLIPASIDPEVIRVIYDALLNQHRFRASYQRREAEELEYEFKPYGLVYRDSVIYLVAAVWDYDDPLHFALHRFIHCEPMDRGFEPPEDFVLQQYINSGAFEYTLGDGNTIRLVAQFTPEAGFHLYETPLSQDQKIVKKRNGWLEIQATVKNTQQLRWWLLGFGWQAKVIRPKALKEELKTLVFSDIQADG
jgi:predicted DNA-binding transcriptional regulator YafY